MAEYMSREDYCEITCGKENREGYKTCHNCSMLNVPSTDVQPVKRELVKITDSDFMSQGYLTIEKFYSCPRCGESFGNVRFSKRSQLADVYKYCYKCGQGLDWS